MYSVREHSFISFLSQTKDLGPQKMQLCPKISSNNSALLTSWARCHLTFSGVLLDKCCYCLPCPRKEIEAQGELVTCPSPLQEGCEHRLCLPCSTATHPSVVHDLSWQLSAKHLWTRITFSISGSFDNGWKCFLNKSYHFLSWLATASPLLLQRQSFRMSSLGHRSGVCAVKAGSRSMG